MANSNVPERDSRLPQKAAKAAPGPGGAAPVRPASMAPIHVAPLFRRIDWLALLLTFGVVSVVYFLTLAPELTLEDSGELVTGSYYAGIPHPPGYPVWTIYSWLWTVLVPVGNPAWRVALAEAFAGALACGLLSLMVSRGSSMFMESIEELKSMTGKWENAICVVSGFVAGLLLGLDGFMWKESVAVNRIAVSSVPWFIIVLLCLLRWLYAPHQARFLYWALFIFGVCFTTHQSLIVAGLGVQVAIAAGNKRLGRDVFFMDFVFFLIYWAYVLVTGQHLFPNIGAKQGLLNIFIMIGVGSIIASIWLAVKTKTRGIEVGRNLALGGVFIFSVLAVLNRSQQGYLFFFAAAALSCLWTFINLARQTWSFSREWLHVLILGVLWLAGASFYLYMPIAGMTNPPMQWGYPRTVEGFWHALSRGQYEQPNPTDVLADPGRFINQLGMLIGGVAEEFTWVYIFMAVVPFVFFFRMQKRERAWLIGLAAIYACLGVLLMILLNPPPDRASSDLVKVFFNNSHTIVAALIGYGLALIAAFMATNYQRFRIWGILGGMVTLALGVLTVWMVTGRHFFGPAGTIPFSQVPHWVGQAFAKGQFGLPVFGYLVLVIVPLGFVLALLAYRTRGPLLLTLGLFAAMPLYSGLAHWYSSDQRLHWFGYWFGHDMFTPPFNGTDGKPIYPQMTKDAILYGGTDPGRFCPTYMVFCESFTPHNCQPAQDQTFDRRDVYIITQNALADGTYLNYIRAHYNRSKQIDAPFFQELFRPAKEKEMNYSTNLFAQMVSPLDKFFIGIGDRVEKRRRTQSSLFTGKDFLDLPAFVSRLKPDPGQDALSKFIYENLASPTRQLLAGSGNEAALRSALAKDLNVLLQRESEARDDLQAKQAQKNEMDQQIAIHGPSDSLRAKQEKLAKEIAELAKTPALYDPDRFKQVQISEYLADFIKENPQRHTRIRLNRLLLEAAYPKLIAASLGGLYPDREMYIATPEDSQRCFNDYLQDSSRRLKHDTDFPTEPKQIRPGEDIRVVDGRVTVSGQVAVMAINGLLTKVMFDHNPKNEFYVEESFPLDWMYPHLTPFGVIMKINRQPLPTLTEDVLQRDHDFWKQYSKRLIGDVIDYDTKLQDIADFIEKTYLRRNFNGFTGDRKFIHDDDGQKAFSKLRSSIGGIYAWRLGPQCPPQFRPKSDAEFQRILKEADFTFRQAFAFCPYSPEAVFRYVNLLLQFNRLDDALIVARTCVKLDPYNGQVRGLVTSLESWKSQRAELAPPPAQPVNGLEAMEKEVRGNPTNLQATIELAKIYVQLQQTGRAMQLLDGVLNSSNADAPSIIRAAMVYSEVSNWAKLEASLERLVKISPESPEAWYDLSAMKANLHKDQEALAGLTTALSLNTQRLQRDPKARNLLQDMSNDVRFVSLRQMAEYQKLVSAR
jgi:thioredoxin-like negative regulator of GroEL